MGIYIENVLYSTQTYYMISWIKRNGNITLSLFLNRH